MNLVQINGNTEAGFQDFEFNIIDYHQDINRNHIIRAMGMFNNDKVGFDIVFRPDMRPGVVEGKFDNTAFSAEGIIIISIGQESDKFIEVLSSLYNQKFKSHHMVEKMGFTSYALSGNPIDFANEDLKFKVFYDDCNNKGLYSELYINVSIPKGIAEIKEKDIEYRKNFYRAIVGDYPNLSVRIYKKIFKKL